MASKANPGQFDCYAAAKPDEPLFVLLGRDRHAATLVLVWALLRHHEGEDPAKVNEALQCADAMDAYCRSIGKHAAAAVLAEILIAASNRLDEHPEGYADACNCVECRSYR